MATAGITNSFKQEILQGGTHALGTNTYKMALYTTSSTNGPDTTAYTATNEVAAGGTYSAGGAVITNGTVIVNNTTDKAFWTPGETTDGGTTGAGDISWTGVTFTTDSALLYQQTTLETVAVFTFASQTVSSGTFTLQMPTNDSTNALIRLA